MKTHLAPLAAVLVLGLAGPALANSQLIANAGLTPAEAQGLTLTEIAQEKFNRSAGFSQNAQPASVASDAARANLARAAGLSEAEAQGLSLSEIAAVKFTKGSSDNDQIRPAASAATIATRSIEGPAQDSRAWAQLIASARLSPEEAAGLTLTEIAAEKFRLDER